VDSSLPAAHGAVSTKTKEDRMNKARWEVWGHNDAGNWGLIAHDERTGTRVHVDRYESLPSLGSWITTAVWPDGDQDLTANYSASKDGKIVLNLGKSVTVWVTRDQAYQLARYIDNTLASTERRPV
jgi:hypothetical protein